MNNIVGVLKENTFQFYINSELVTMNKTNNTALTVPTKFLLYYEPTHLINYLIMFYGKDNLMEIHFIELDIKKDVQEDQVGSVMNNAFKCFYKLNDLLKKRTHLIDTIKNEQIKLIKRSTTTTGNNKLKNVISLEKVTTKHGNLLKRGFIDLNITKTPTVYLKNIINTDEKVKRLIKVLTDLRMKKYHQSRLITTTRPPPSLQVFNQNKGDKEIFRQSKSLPDKLTKDTIYVKHLRYNGDLFKSKLIKIVS